MPHVASLCAAVASHLGAKVILEQVLRGIAASQGTRDEGLHPGSEAISRHHTDLCVCDSNVGVERNEGSGFIDVQQLVCGHPFLLRGIRSLCVPQVQSPLA